jgi:ATP-dependent helicase/DNAse subunit B
MLRKYNSDDNNTAKTFDIYYYAGLNIQFLTYLHLVCVNFAAKLFKRNLIYTV